MLTSSDEVRGRIEMPSNPLKKILEGRGEASGPSSSGEALEKLNREVQESKRMVRQQNEKLARDYFESSIAALKRQVEESRAALEGLPEQVPDGHDEGFRAFVGELMEGYSSVEKALDQAGDTIADSEAEEPDVAEAPDAGPEENGAEEDVVEDEGSGKASGALIEGADEEPKATDAARRKAEELGVDLTSVKGSGADGLVTIQDVVKL